MSKLTGYLQLFDGDTSSVDSSAVHTVGSRAFDTEGNEYVYLKGVASTTANMVVSYDESYLSTLAIADTVGLVAVAQAATIADTWGWYMISGVATLIANAAISADKALCVTASAGWVDDAAVAGDLIHGVIGRTSASAQEDEITAQIAYPYCDDVTES